MIQTIYPYIDSESGWWVFDDQSRWLRREPFVAGADRIIDKMTASIPDATEGFALEFSDQAFAGCQTVLFRLRKQHGGTVYFDPSLDLTGWLCPALLLYFEQPPERIYAKFSRKEPS